MTDHKTMASELLAEATGILTRYWTDDRSKQWKRAELLIDAARVHASLAEIEAKE